MNWNWESFSVYWEIHHKLCLLHWSKNKMLKYESFCDSSSTLVSFLREKVISCHSTVKLHPSMQMWRECHFLKKSPISFLKKAFDNLVTTFYISDIAHRLVILNIDLRKYKVIQDYTVIYVKEIWKPLVITFMKFLLCQLWLLCVRGSSCRLCALSAIKIKTSEISGFLIFKFLWVSSVFSYIRLFGLHCVLWLL